MDGQYGIAVTNKFCLLEEGEDILDVTNQKLEAQKVEKENAAKLPKTKAKVVKKTTFEKRNDNNKTNLGNYLIFKIYILFIYFVKYHKLDCL